jgi:hypothetical protein
MTRHHTQAMRAITLHTRGGPERLIPAEIPRLFYGQWNLLGTTMGSSREFDQLLAHARLEQPDRFGKVVLECRST